MRKLFLGLTSLLLVGLLITPSYAAQFKAEEESISLNESQSYNNLYLAGATVSIDSEVKGDLTVFGGSVIVNGPVENNLYVLGGNITVRSNVGHSIKIAGGSVIISGKVNSDVIVAGGVVNIDKNATIEGDLIAGAGELKIDGIVKGATRVGAENLTINGQVGLVSAYLQGKLRVGSQAVVKGRLKYQAPTEGEINSGAQISEGIEYNKASLSRLYPFMALGYWLTILGAILALWLLVTIMPKFAHKFVKLSNEQVLLNLLYGLIILIFIPIAVIILLISGLGSLISLILGSLYLLILGIANLLSKLLAGYYLMKIIKRDAEPSFGLPLVATGVLSLAVVSFLPYLGTLIGFFLFLLALGLITRIIFQARASF